MASYFRRGHGKRTCTRRGSREGERSQTNVGGWRGTAGWRRGGSVVGGRGSEGGSIVTYIKIPISRLRITSVVYHANRTLQTSLLRAVHVLQTARPSSLENLESTSVPFPLLAREDPYKINRFMCKVTAKCIFIDTSFFAHGGRFRR